MSCTLGNDDQRLRRVELAGPEVGVVGCGRLEVLNDQVGEDKVLAQLVRAALVDFLTVRILQFVFGV